MIRSDLCTLFHVFGVLCLLLFMADVVNGQSLMLDKPECKGDRLQKADKDMIRLIGVGKGGRKFPLNFDELKSYCKETFRLVNEIEKFIQDCYRSDVIKVAKIFLFSVKRSVKPFCTKRRNNKQKQYVKSGPCVNTFIEDIDCLDVYVNKTKSLIPLNIGADKINHICCNFVKLIQCEEKVLNEHKCITNEAKEVFMDLTRSISGDIVNFACGEYNESTDRCDNIKKPTNEQKDHRKTIDHKVKSFYFTNLAVMESIDGLFFDTTKI